jgi:hypothetical protein
MSTSPEITVRIATGWAAGLAWFCAARGAPAMPKSIAAHKATQDVMTAA